MAAPHFFVDSLEAPVRLSAHDSRHALRSLRLRPGDAVTVADGHGGVAGARLAGEEDGRVAVDVGPVGEAPRPVPRLSVALAPPKGDRLAWAIQKLAEMGVDEAVLVRSERSVRAWDPGRAERALRRLRAVAREAAMQSRRPFLMGVEGGVELGDVLGDAVPSVMLWEGEAAPLTSVLPEAATAVRLVVGPEGGFAEGEVERAVAGGAVLGSLGPGILRTETAAVVGAALALSRYGRLG